MYMYIHVDNIIYWYILAFIETKYTCSFNFKQHTQFAVTFDYPW